MLTLFIGRAGTGKTTAVMEAIKRRMGAGESGLLLIVPEQYSHDAERQLCAVCGDGLPLYGETLSFTGFARRVFSETGGTTGASPDAGGLMLLMHRAFESVAHKLAAFTAGGSRTEMTEMLLNSAEEFKSRGIDPDMLGRIALQVSNPLADKLRDLALIYSAYDALLCVYFGDRPDRLELLAEKICESSVTKTGGAYFDGFSDFTAQELRVIEELLINDADVTVCLTCDPFVYNNRSDSAIDIESGIFGIPMETAAKLNRIANDNGIGVRVVEFNQTATPDGKAPELLYLEKHLFTHDRENFPGECSAVKLFQAPSRHTECEYVASQVWELVRNGYRWRDIGLVARNWEEYGPVCETVFEKYGIPFFSGGRADILDKPPAAFICAALEIVAYGWEYKTVFKYIKTGLAGLCADEYAELENYVIKWDIRGVMWMREWTLPPSGYGAEADAGLLERINRSRSKIVEPLVKLRDGVKGSTAASGKLQALYLFLDDIAFYDRILEKADRLIRRGESRLAGEYTQLWDVVINAFGQMFEILGDSVLSAVEFCKLFALTLSRYDVGVIPVSLDSTALGGMAMSRRRDLKCLFVLGATDDNLPMLSKGGGALNDNERLMLKRLGADLPAGLEERLCREMNLLYSTLTLPSRELVVTYPAAGGERPSFVIKRLMAMFGVAESRLSEEEYMTAAPAPCFELAIMAGATNFSALAAAAGEYFKQAPGDYNERLERADPTADARRQPLLKHVAERLYGLKPVLSASSVDRYYSCPYMHFLVSGLKLSPRVPAAFDAQAAGVFMHFVLEGVSREIIQTAGFRNASEEQCRALTSGYIERYVADVLQDFEGVDARFEYLFRRLGDDVHRIVIDTQNEMKHSDFLPLDFELDFKELQGLDRKNRDDPALRGIVDRVDGWTSGESLYLRVVDYKTGVKHFVLSDLLYGRNMQMLIYLFALQKYGAGRYNASIRPAGVLYVPARDTILKAPRNATDKELESLREQAKRRDGLILSEPQVLEAMENGEVKKYLPVKAGKDGQVGGDCLVSREQIDVLSKHVDQMLRRASAEISNGSIDVSPYYKNERENACFYCEYRAVCGFEEESGDKPRFARPYKTGEVWKRLEAGPKA